MIQGHLLVRAMIRNHWRCGWGRLPLILTLSGLSDQKQQGSWLWTDSKPLTFSDWAVVTQGGSTVAQPDGATVEDCSMILLDNLYSTRTWHDIPCAFNQVKQYLCKKSLNMEVGE